MTITESQVRRIMPNAKDGSVKAFTEAFNKYSEQFGIDTKLRVCGFLSNVAHESGELRYTEENLNYSADALLRVFPKYFTRETAVLYARNPQRIANRVYANRMGNGPEASGDGWRFRGRGLIQLTGRKTYQRYADSAYCVGDLMAHPEWLAEYPGALKSAMWYWQANSLNRFADREDVRGLCKAINGGLNGYAQRAYYWRVAKKVFGL